MRTYFASFKLSLSVRGTCHQGKESMGKKEEVLFLVTSAFWRIFSEWVILWRHLFATLQLSRVWYDRNSFCRLETPHMFPLWQSLLFSLFPVIFSAHFFQLCAGKKCEVHFWFFPAYTYEKKGFPFQTTINPRRENGVSASATVIFTTRKGGEKRHCTTPRFPHSTPRKLSIVFSFRGGGGSVNYGVMLRSPTNADFIHMFRVYLPPPPLPIPSSICALK